MYAVNVVFQPDGRPYTYVVDGIELKDKDLVVVPVENKFKLAQVIKVMETDDIPTDTGITYRYVVQKVCFEAYNALIAKNKGMQFISKHHSSGINSRRD